MSTSGQSLDAVLHTGGLGRTQCSSSYAKYIIQYMELLMVIQLIYLRKCEVTTQCTTLHWFDITDSFSNWNVENTAKHYTLAHHNWLVGRLQMKLC